MIHNSDSNPGSQPIWFGGRKALPKTVGARIGSYQSIPRKESNSGRTSKRKFLLPALLMSILVLVCYCQYKGNADRLGPDYMKNLENSASAAVSSSSQSVISTVSAEPVSAQGPLSPTIVKGDQEFLHSDSHK